MANRGRYASIYRALVNDPAFLALNADARHLLLTLRITDLGNVAGIFVYYQDAIRVQTGLPLKRLVRAFDELERTTWVLRQGRLIWGRNFLRFEPTYSLADPKKKKGIENILESLPRLPLVRQFATYYDLICPEGVPALEEHPEGPPAAGLGSPSEAPLKGLPNPIPYQDQDQDQVAGSGSGSVRLADETPARRVVRFWRSALDHEGAKISSDRIKIAERALGLGYTELELAWTICGCGMDPWSMGQNDRSTVFDRLGLILRDSEKIESYRQFIPEEDVRGIFQKWLKSGEVVIPEHLRGKTPAGVAADGETGGPLPDGPDEAPGTGGP